MNASDQPQAQVAPQTYLAYHQFFWLKVSPVLTAVCILAYIVDRPVGGPSGGSWLGYGLGSLSFGLMIWLMWFGVRKRQYGSSRAPLMGWLSAHVYLGLTLLVIVPLHMAFQVGFNIHTLAFAVMIATILTGFVGILLYDRLPAQITRNRPGQELAGLYEQIAEIDSDCRNHAAELPDPFVAALRDSLEETYIGGGLIAQLRGRDKNCGTERALETVNALNRRPGVDAENRADIRALIEDLSIKRRVLVRIRRDIRYKALLDTWLILHVPLAFASVLLVAVHIFVVFYYR
jgi:hypothetical protein